MPTEVLPLRYRDARTGKWLHARYRATGEEIQQRYEVWEINDTSDICVGNGVMFAPFRRLSALLVGGSWGFSNKSRPGMACLKRCAISSREGRRKPSSDQSIGRLAAS